MFTVRIETTAVKQLKTLDVPQQRIIAKKLRLLETPEKLQSNISTLKRPLMGFRLRIGDYRILFIKDDKKKLITVYLIKHRRDVYK